MNVENIRLTQASIARENALYDQRYYGNGCGTPLCVAGHAVVACGGYLRERVGTTFGFSDRWMEAVDEDEIVRNVEFLAKQYLGLSMRDACEMFKSHPFANRFSKRLATKAEALAMLDRFIETGKVEWRKKEEARCA